MANNECCKLVGNLDLGLDGCIISVSTSCSTEVGATCGDEPVEGPSIGTVNITAYGSSELWTGCTSKAGVSIPFVRKYDCVNDIVYFIFSGQGQSFYTGTANTLVSLSTVLETSCTSMNASSQGGPASIYTESTQYNGYGMTYTGDPISFTTSKDGTEADLGDITDGITSYLQSFSLDLQPAQLPVVSYTFVYPMGGVS